MTSHPANRRVAYLLKTFPRLSETFILNEILGIERLGARLHIFSLKRPDSEPVHTAVLSDRALILTPVEFDLLASLARARGRVKTREALLEECRERDYDVFDRSIDVHISALRRKLDDDPKNPRFIRTVRAAGYMMVDPRAQS